MVKVSRKRRAEDDARALERLKNQRSNGGNKNNTTDGGVSVAHDQNITNGGGLSEHQAAHGVTNITGGGPVVNAVIHHQPNGTGVVSGGDRDQTNGTEEHLHTQASLSEVATVASITGGGIVSSNEYEVRIKQLQEENERLRTGLTGNLQDSRLKLLEEENDRLKRRLETLTTAPPQPRYDLNSISQHKITFH
jgi:hypothetical protein